MKDREKRFCELDDQIETLSIDEQNFMLWQLLKKYADRLEIPERCETIEDYRKYKVNHDLLVEGIDYINNRIVEVKKIIANRVKEQNPRYKAV